MSFGVILADPPWRFETYSEKGGDRAAPYSCMSVDDIAGLPIADVAAENSVCLMWVIDPMIEDGYRVMRAWGFKPKTVGFYWVKTSGGFELFTGLGYWTRANPEQCILGTRGKPKRISKSVHRVIMAPVQKHSAKPRETYERTERLVRGPYLELFARHCQPGWSQWGNQVGLRGGEPNPFDLPGLPATVVRPEQGSLL